MPRSAAALLPALLCLLVATAPRARAQAPETLAVGTKEAPPFAMKDAQGDWTGISIELWEDVAVGLAAESGAGFAYEERTLEGLLAGVEDGSLDVAVAALSATAEREGRMDFTHPFHTSGLGIVVPARRAGGLEAILENLVSAEFARAAGALLLLLVSVGLLVWLFERNRNREQFGGRGLKALGEGVWFSAVTMTTVGYGDKAPRTLGGRLVTLVWMFASLIVVAGFTAAIASSLTVASLETSIRGPDDLPGHRVATVANTTSESQLRAHGVAPATFADPGEALRAVADGQADAAVYDAPMMQYLVSQEFAGRLTVLPATFNRQDYAFALPRDSALRKPLNRAILARITKADWQETLRRYLGG